MKSTGPVVHLFSQKRAKARAPPKTRLPEDSPEPS
jgi:hypothetical protein